MLSIRQANRAASRIIRSGRPRIAGRQPKESVHASSFPSHSLLLAVGSLLAATAAAQDETRQVGGLSAPAEVLTDRWGLDHIYADSEEDLFFIQGYRAAENRLFQFEMWRRQATGTVAAILGPSELQRDIGIRLHMFRKDMGEEMRWYHPHGDKIIPAFVRGINAAVERARQSPDSLPLEFRLLGILPEPWTEEVVISRHQGLLSNVTQELNYGMAVAAVGAEALMDIGWFRPGIPQLELDSAIDGSLLKPEILDSIALSGPGDLQAGADRRRVPERGRRTARTPSGNPFRTESGGPRRTYRLEQLGGARRADLDGLPLIVNDPHRTIVAPSLRYFVHLEAPGWSVIGGGEPVLPGLSIGHNEKGGWGLTVFGQDNEDLMVYNTNPSDPNQYRYLGEWESMTSAPRPSRSRERPTTKRR